MTDALDPATGLRIERVLPAPVADVFRAWADPASMAEWISPSGRAEVQADVRVGGSFRIVMLDDGVRIDHEGEYIVVEAPRKLVFTWRSAYTGTTSSVVTVLLTPRGDETALTLTHERLPAEHRDSHQGGWGAILDNLMAALERSRRDVGQPGRPEGVPRAR
jgi:uncharacterized protein YndB with AHSA1/START domain